MVFDFSTTLLFRTHTPTLKTPTTQGFSSKECKTVHKHILAKHKYLTDHNYHTQLHNTKENWNPAEAEALDRDFQQSSGHALNQCKRKPNLNYVKQIVQLCTEKHILNCIISQSRTQVDMVLPIQ